MENVSKTTAKIFPKSQKDAKGKALHTSVVSLCLILLAEGIGYEGCAALGYSASHGNYDEEHGKGNGQCSQGIGGNEPREESIHHVVHGIEKEPDAGGNGDFSNQSGDRVVGQIHS